MLFGRPRRLPPTDRQSFALTQRWERDVRLCCLSSTQDQGGCSLTYNVTKSHLTVDQCDKPALAEDCASCQRLNIQCIDGPGSLVPRRHMNTNTFYFRHLSTLTVSNGQDELRQVIKHHNRRPANRRGPPLWLAEYISVLSFDNFSGAAPSPATHGADTPLCVAQSPVNRLKVSPLASSSLPPISPSSQTKYFSMIDSSYGNVQEIIGHHWLLQYAPHNTVHGPPSPGRQRTSLLRVPSQPHPPL